MMQINISSLIILIIGFVCIVALIIALDVSIYNCAYRRGYRAGYNSVDTFTDNDTSVIDVDDTIKPLINYYSTNIDGPAEITFIQIPGNIAVPVSPSVFKVNLTLDNTESIKNSYLNIIVTDKDIRERIAMYMHDSMDELQTSPTHMFNIKIVHGNLEVMLYDCTFEDIYYKDNSVVIAYNNAVINSK